MTRNPVEDGENFSAVYWSAMLNAIDNEQVNSGCTPSAGAGSWDVEIASGEVYVAGKRVSVSSQTVTVSSSGSDDRADLVSINSNGTASVTQGTAATDPNAPSIPSDEVAVAVVHVRGGSSSLSPSDIKDYRALASSPFNVEVVASGTTTLSAGDSTKLYDPPTDLKAVDGFVMAYGFLENGRQLTLLGKGSISNDVDIFVRYDSTNNDYSVRYSNNESSSRTLTWYVFEFRNQ